MNQLFGYRAGKSFIHRLTGGTKLLVFLILTMSGMVSFDLRYLVLLLLVSVGMTFRQWCTLLAYSL